MSNLNQTTEPLPIKVIMDAIGGDEDAIKAVVKHYERYIEALATKKLYDDEGRQYLFVDDELKREMELKLITKVATFKPLATQAA